MAREASGRVKAVQKSIWGEATEEQAGRKNPRIDRWFIPGYSDKMAENERRMARGLDPIPMPYRFQFVSVSNEKGEPVTRNMADYESRGYRFVQYDEKEFKKLGIECPLGAVKTADGKVRVATQVLMYAPAAVAAALARAKQNRTERRLHSAAGRVGDAVAAYNAEAGVPTQAIFEDSSEE